MKRRTKLNVNVAGELCDDTQPLFCPLGSERRPCNVRCVWFRLLEAKDTTDGKAYAICKDEEIGVFSEKDLS